MTDFRITPGFSNAERTLAAELYWEAFGNKLALGLGPESKAKAFLARVANPDFALCARDDNGTLLGIAGFKTSEGALIGGDFADLRAIYGTFGAAWRGLLLSLLERDLQGGSLLMDGIFTAQTARGKGVGTALLRAIKQDAIARGCSEVRLDVIDTNPRARALYEREGFVAGKVQRLGPLKYLFGFSSATEMHATLQPHSR